MTEENTMENIIEDLTELTITENEIKIRKGEIDITYQEKRSRIGIHTPTIKDMEKVVKVLEKYYDCSFDDLQYIYINKKDVKKGEGYYIQGFNYSSEYLKSPSIKLNCSEEDKVAIHEILGIKKLSNKWLWYPNKIEKKEQFMKGNTTNKYPIYVISKGRFYRNRKYQAPMTCQYLETIGVDYKIVIEPREEHQYIKSISKDKIILLPDKYLNRNQGSIPARNYVHHLNIHNKERAYWILDDNICDYHWLDNNQRYKVRDAITFRIIEDLMDNYENVYLAAHQYKMFRPPTDYSNNIQHNGRCFSSILIRTDIITLNDDRDIWRGKYNEDVDLSLRILKLGLPTILLNVLTADKIKTGGRGGNHDIYTEDNNHSGVEKSRSLLEHHADCIDIVPRYGRMHHKIRTIQFENNKYMRVKDFKENQYNIEYY